MGVRNTDKEYGSIAKFFHWTAAILIIALLLVGWLMHQAGPSIKGTIYNTHKLVGLFILAMTVPRLIWAFLGIKPKLPNAMNPWEKVAERIVHFGLYLSLFLMPLFGWAMSTAAGRAPRIFDTSIALPGIIQSKPLAHFCSSLHTFFAWVIVALITLHVGAALKHHFINKDNVLLTMMPRKKR